jgi:hypothetical protein
MDEVAVACPPAYNNNDARARAICVGAITDSGGGTTYACSSPPLGRRATAYAVVRLMQVVLTSERLSPLPSRTLRPVFVQDNVRTTQFFMATTTSTSTSATSATRGYHLHVVLTGFYSSHSICVITMLQLRGMSVRQILPLTYSPISPSVVLSLWLWGDVRVYLVGYIFCIIDYHICQDIFGRLYILYNRLSYMSKYIC